MKHLEDKEQIALMTWVRLMSVKYPLLQCVYHTPNGGYREPRVAAKFKAMGVKAGVWDLYVPAPTPGLWVEMKSQKGRLTTEQNNFRNLLTPHGYHFVVARSWVEGANAICEFMNIPESDRPDV